MKAGVLVLSLDGGVGSAGWKRLFPAPVLDQLHALVEGLKMNAQVQRQEGPANVSKQYGLIQRP